MALEMLIDIFTRMTGRCSIHFPGRVAIGQKVTGRCGVDCCRQIGSGPASGGGVLEIAAANCGAAKQVNSGGSFRPHHLRQHFRPWRALLLLQIAVLVLVEDRRRR